MYKRVKVAVKETPGGILRPLSVIWDDGRVFHITEVVRVLRNIEYEWDKRATCYEIKIGDHRTDLWQDRDGWFVKLKS